jgi:thiamine-monophosphate kinase
MGAEPAWCLLALTVPDAEPRFLQPFADGLLALAQRHGVALVGGDTTRGPLSVSVQALGLVPAGQALRRSGGKPGDLLYEWLARRSGGRPATRAGQFFFGCTGDRRPAVPA